MKKITFAFLLILLLLSACTTATVTPTAENADSQQATSAPAPNNTQVPPTATAAPTETSSPDPAETKSQLQMNPWKWVSFTSPVEQVEIEMPDNYLIQFNADGSYNLKADCNIGGGDYTFDGSSISIKAGMLTKVMCPPGSRSDDYLKFLNSAAVAFFDDGSLLVDLMADGGTMKFSPADKDAFAGGSSNGPEGALSESLVAQLDAFLESQVYTEGGYQVGAAPGLVLLVDTPEGRYLKAAGVSSLEEGTPIKADDRLQIGSNTKSFLIVVLMQLQEEGVLDLDDPLSKWLPDLAAQIPNGKDITLRHLASHTSGIWDYGNPLIGEAANDSAKLEQEYKPEELVAYATENGTPDFAPGEGFKYCNTGYILLGMVVEKATGKTADTLFKERIFEPLNLETAVLINSVPRPEELTSQGYWWKEDGTRLNTTRWNASQGWVAGANAMTAEDLATYGKALASGSLFKNPDSLKEMLTFDDQSLMVSGAPFGLGLMSMGDGYWGHEGQTAGFQSLWYTNPEQGITVVGLTNSAAYEAYAFLQVREILSGAGVKPVQAASLLPIAAQFPFPTNWTWAQVMSPANTVDMQPGIVLSLSRDGKSTILSEECGFAAGKYTSTPQNTITFDLDTSDVTCSGSEPMVELIGLLGQAETWNFGNGDLIFHLSDGTQLRFVRKVAP